HHDAELDERRDRPPFEVEHRRGLAEKRGFRKIGPAWIGDRRNADLLSVVAGREALEPAHAGLAEAFRVRHDVRLRDWNEVCRAEELADLDLVPQRLLQHGSGLSGQDVVLFGGELHRSQSGVAPDSRTALPHLSISPRWN